MLDDGPLVKQKSASSVPSLRTMYHLRHADEIKLSSENFTSIIKPGDLRNVLALSEPPLPLAGIESIAITSLFQGWPMEAASMDRTDFLSVMQRSQAIHISTHGNLHKHSSWLSSISLQKIFRVLDMTDVVSETALCVFAAGFSGLGKTTTGNDIQGFSHAVLASGCKAFIGAFWKADDLSAFLLMLFFYRGLAYNNE
jgi:CHAT domain-containing protein